MSAFPDWEKYIVKQKLEETGCIAAGYEIILRAAGCKHVNFETFQNDFDLDKDRKLGEPARNNFESVAQAVQSKYPTVYFKHRSFAKNEGQMKLVVIEELINRQLPTLVSLARVGLEPPFQGKGWHIMPVVDASSDNLTLFWGMDQKNVPISLGLSKRRLVLIHESYDGGNDIAFLDKLPSDATSNYNSLS